MNRDANSLPVLLHCSINDNEGVAETLIDTLGPAIVNTTDSKSR